MLLLSPQGRALARVSPWAPRLEEAPELRRGFGSISGNVGCKEVAGAGGGFARPPLALSKPPLT